MLIYIKRISYKYIMQIDFIVLIDVFFNFDDFPLVDCWELAVLQIY